MKKASTSFPSPSEQLTKWVRQLKEPENYHLGVGCDARQTFVRNVLFFSRTDRDHFRGPVDPRSYCHHRYELVVPLETEGTVFTDGHFLDIAPGQLALVHPFETHGFSRIAKKDMLWFFATFEIYGDPIFHGLHKQAALIPPEMWPLLDMMRTRYGYPLSNTLQTEALLHLLGALLSIMDDYAQHHAVSTNEPSRSPRPHAVLVRNVCHYIDQHFDEGVRIEDVARYCSLSESRLRTLFRKEVSMSLGRYMRLRRVHRAAQMLRDTGCRVSEIALRCGFDSLYSFSRTFRNEMSLSPTEYRKQTV